MQRGSHLHVFIWDFIRVAYCDGKPVESTPTCLACVTVPTPVFFLLRRYASAVMCAGEEPSVASLESRPLSPVFGLRIPGAVCSAGVREH